MIAKIAPNAPGRDRLTKVAQEARNRPAAWLEQRAIYGDLADNPDFVAAFGKALNDVWANGTAATIRAYLG